DPLRAALLAKLPARPATTVNPWFVRRPTAAAPSDSPSARLDDRLPLEALARVLTDALAPHRPSYIRLPLGWPGEYCRFAHPQDYIGFDGGGGIGSGPGGGRGGGAGRGGA